MIRNWYWLLGQKSLYRKRFVRIQVDVFCVVTLCSIAVGHLHFGRPCCLYYCVGGRIIMMQNVFIPAKV
jgi:hypothetical protein